MRVKKYYYLYTNQPTKMKKPSVSELLKLLDKPALLKWSNDIGLKGIKLEDYRKKSTGDGTNLHNQIEQYFTNGVCLENPIHQEALEQMMLGKEFINCEQKIENKWFVGRYDIMLGQETDIFICDFKSSNRIYFEQRLQLSAYQMCFPESKIAVIQIPSFKFTPINIDFEQYQNILKALSYIYTTKYNLNER